jgi:putative heme-binding domain-containing protein
MKAIVFSVLSLCLCASVFCLSSHALAQQDAPKDVNPDPDLERKTFKVADGFEVNLFAADPLLAKPIAMNFDPAGRLWVACSEAYPQIKPGQTQNDKIIILEDTDGKGRANKTTVFADGLLIPTGIEPGDGGVYVAASTDLLHLSDPDGKGKATRRKIVLSGFGTEDTHHMLHTLRWGPDGMLYMNQSVYIHSHIETPYGVRRLGGGGIWQFRPETERLEVFARGWWNAWGHHFDRWGQSFVTDGAGTEGINYVVPGGSYAATPNAPRVLQGLNPGSPKYCGEEILSGRHIPDDWRGNIITNDFRGHRVCRFVLKEDGAGYLAQEKTELIKSDHPAFRPVDVKMGPDGAIYIADWYNPIIQHGEVDFRDPRRDQTHGRIWRVTAKDRPLVEKPKLVGAETKALLDALKVPEDWTRHHAKRVLKVRGADKVVPALAEWVKGLDAKDAEYEHHLLEALWTYQSLDTVEPKLLVKLLASKDHHIRAAATRALSYWHDRIPHAQELLAAAAADDHPRVRLEAVRALSQIPTAQAAELAATALDRPMDKFLDYSVWLTMRDLQPAWLPAVQKGEFDFNGSLRHLTFALQAAGSREGIQPLVNLYRAGKVPKDRVDGVLALIAGLGGPQELALVVEVIRNDDTPDARKALLLDTLAQSARLRKVKQSGDLGAVSALLKSENESVRCSAARLAGLWQLDALRPMLRDYAAGKNTSEPVRRAALEGLVSLGGKESRAALEELCNSTQPAEIRRLAVIALASVDVKAAAAKAVELLAAGPSADAAVELFAAFQEQKEGAAALVAALAEHKLPEDTAKVGVRTARETGRDVTALVDALNKAGGLSGKARKFTTEETKQFVADVAKLGDPTRGEAVFRRKDQVCLKCHAIGGAGGQVGPDLSSIGASAQVDYLIESLLEPNKVVKEGYHSMTVTTSKGKVFTGIKVRQTDKELILRTGEDQEIGIPLDAIDDQKMSGSLMPEGLTDPLTRPELIDLVRFLSELGKIGPYQVGQARVVRRWQVLNATEDARRAFLRDGPAAAATDAPWQSWSSAYSKVEGPLPADALPRVEIQPRAKPAQSLAFARFQVDVSTAGKVKFLLNSVEGLTFWVDGKAVDAKPELEVELAKSTHTITFAVDLAKQREGIRCELEEARGSPARARLVGGK